MNQQDLQGLEVPENQSVPLDQDLLCHPGKAKHPVNKNKHNTQRVNIAASYPLSKNTIFAWWTIRSCRTLRTNRNIETLTLNGELFFLPTFAYHRQYTYIRTRIPTGSFSTRDTNRTRRAFLSRLSS